MPKPEVTIVGHVGRDPKQNTTRAGTPIATFPVAENHWRWDGRTRQWERVSTSWFQVTCKWGLAEHVQESISTGQSVIVVGRLKIAEWFDGNGVKQVTAEVDATSVGHDLRRGTSEFTRVERARSSAPSTDEEAEIRGMRDEPPEEPPDPFESTGDDSAGEPPADPPVDNDDADDNSEDQSSDSDSNAPFPAEVGGALTSV